jgi:hypothetical protein
MRAGPYGQRDADDGAAAEIADDAVLDTDISDEELGDLLGDAGYDADASAADETVMDDGSSADENVTGDADTAAAPEEPDASDTDMSAPEEAADAAAGTDASGE